MKKIKLDRTTKLRYKIKKSNIEEKILVQLNKLNYIFNRNRVLELVEIAGNTKRFLIRNLTSGIIKGIGVGIGFYLITAFIIYLLQRIIKLNIPILSKYISDIVEIVQNTK